MRVGPKRATIAGMNLAGIGIAALVLGAVLIGVSVVVADPEPAFWPWLWARIVEVQTMVGAIVGLVGLGGVAWANAAATRRRTTGCASARRAALPISCAPT